MNLIRRILGSLVWRLIVSMIFIQLFIVFIVYRNTLSQYEEYVSQNSAVIEDTVEKIFIEFHNLQDPEFSSYGTGDIAPTQSEDESLKYLWDHVLENNPDLWFNIESRTLSSAYGDVPAEARNIRLMTDSRNRSLAGCYELTGQREAEAEQYYISEIACGSRGYLAWAIGGVNSQYKFPEAFVDYETSSFLVNIFKSAGIFSVSIFLIIPLAVLLVLRPVQRFAKRVEKFSLSNDAVRLPLDQVPTELDAFVSAVNRAFARVQESYERENIFRAAMAHELRTPLTILSARIDLLKDTDVKRRLKEDVRTMTRLINRLLHLAEITAVDADTQIFDLSDLTQDVVESLEEFAGQSGQSLSLELAPQPVLINVNRDTFELALSNIITNSIRHGDGAERRNKKPVEIKVSPQAHVTIRDYGNGFPAHVLSAANGASQDREPNKKPPGGVGMMIIQAAMRSMHAKAVFENISEGGAKTHLHFPLHQTLDESSV